MTRRRDPSLLHGVLFLGGAAGLAVAVYGPWAGDGAGRVVLAWLVGINASTVAAFAYDKAVAGRTVSRVPERILLGLAFLGGSPGGLLAMGVLRHKTVKSSFRLRFGLVLAAQIVLLAGLWWWNERSSA